MDLKEDLIWKESFFKDNFSVDQCLSKYTQKSDLETLRRELKNYGAELQQQMSEILKTETEAIINLAEYLTNLNSKIENLSVPICQLREEIRTLYDLILSAESSYKVMLEDIKCNNTKRNHINLKIGILSSSVYIDKLITYSEGDSFEDLIILERVVNKYSFQRNYMDELGIMSVETEGIVKHVENKLIEMVNRKFLNSFKNYDSDVLTRCLRMYDNLRKQDEAQKTFQENVVRPALAPLLTENYLEKSHQNLDKVYDEVLVFMNKLSILDDILLKNPELKSFNFTLNSFWKEFDKQSREGLLYITAPGNPELFQKRFKSTWAMLLKIVKKCGNENLMREDDTFQEHLKRFNLPVYFEIRYQQIAGNFENDIFIENNDIYASDNELSCKLKNTLALWKALLQCFNTDVYIDQLADQFLKLSMMLLSRYLRWFRNILQDNSLFSGGAAEWENFIIDSLIDLSIVENFIALDTESLHDVDKTVYKILNQNMKFLVLRVFKTNRKLLSEVQSSLKNHLIDIKFEESSVHLQNVGAIPRLYRRTNRSAPKDASPYMIEAVKPIIHFQNKFKPVIQNQLDEILNDIIIKITKQYLTLVQEVLRSVCKTEESLRRLKSRNVNPNEETTPQSDTMSDEMKIREQIKFDVTFFLGKLYPLGSPIAREVMDMLKKETS